MNTRISDSREKHVRKKVKESLRTGDDVGLGQVDDPGEDEQVGRNEKHAEIWGKNAQAWETASAKI